MQIPPLSVIVSWPTPNYDHPETRGNALLGLLIVFSFLMVTAIIGRLYSRLIIKNWLGWDDALIVLATIFAIGMNVTVILANQEYGWNRHIWDVRPTTIQNANIVAFVAKLLFVEAATFTRISLICFYYRLVRDSGIEWFRWVLHASMIIVVAMGIAFTCLGIWLCVPVQSYWVYPPDFGHYHCLSEGTTTLIIGVLNCLVDLLVTLLPVPLVMKLQMPLKHRIGVCILLSLGFVVTIAGIVRTYFIWKSLMDSWDETWFSYPLWICATIEIDVAVMCACAPALKPLLRKPISSLTSKISSLRSSHHTDPSAAAAGQTPANSTGRSSRLRFYPFHKKSGGDSIWDGEEEYGMLKQRELEKGGAGSSVTRTLTTTTLGGSGELLEMTDSKMERKGPPPLEILKRQSVDQTFELVEGPSRSWSREFG